jgi:hypothetical protein
MAVFLRFAGSFCFSALLAWGVSAQSVPATPPVKTSPVLLPPDFSGWTATAAPQAGNVPESIDAANAAVLKEYGLKDFATGDYRHGSGHIAVKAMRFVDATGAYGAFTYYRKPEMRAETIGSGAAGDADEVVFWAGTTMVDATGEHLGAAETTALNALAVALPQKAGPDAAPPSLPNHLPAEGLENGTAHYAIGPEAYQRSGGVLPPALVDFSRDAEVLTAQYKSHDGHGTLTLLEYPTPQIAAERAKAIDAALKAQPLPGNAAALAVKHSGPLVAVTSGSFSDAEVQRLLGAVKFEAAVTWNHPEGYVNEVKKTANFLLGVIYLIGILGAATILLGLFLGGGRALFRVLRGKSASTLNEDEFISLKLRS